MKTRPIWQTICAGRILVGVIGVIDVGDGRGGVCAQHAAGLVDVLHREFERRGLGRAEVAQGNRFEGTGRR